MMKESKIGIVIIAAIVVLGVVFLSINLKNSDVKKIVKKLGY